MTPAFDPPRPGDPLLRCLVAAVRVALLAMLLAVSAPSPSARAADPAPDVGGTVPLADVNWGGADFEAEKADYAARIEFYEREYRKLRFRADTAKSAIVQRTGEWTYGEQQAFHDSVRQNDIGIGAARGMLDWGNKSFAAKDEWRALTARHGEAGLADPDIRARVWSKHFEWLRYRNASETFAAVYQEQVLAHLDIYEGWDWTALLAGLQEDLFYVSRSTFDQVLNEAIGGCIDDIIHKVTTDQVWQRTFGWTPAGGAALASDCLQDVAKGLMIHALVTGAEVNFLRAVEERGVPRPVGAFWWKEFIVAEAPAKPGFGTAIESIFREGELRPTLYKVVTRTSKRMQRDLIARRVTDEKMKWAREQVRRYVAEGQDPKEVRRFVDQVAGDAVENMKPQIAEAVDEAAEWDRVLVAAEVAEVGIKLGERLATAYYNYADFSLANEVDKYHDIVDCLHQRGEPTDVEAYKKVIRIYDTWIVNCRPDADAKRKRDLDRVRELLAEIDPGALPTDLPARLEEAGRKADAFETGPFADTKAEVDALVVAYDAYCATNPEIWLQIEERMHNVRLKGAQIADAKGEAGRAEKQACEAENVSAAKAASETATDAHVFAADLLTEIRDLGDPIEVDAEKMPEEVSLEDLLSEAVDIDNAAAELDEAVRKAHDDRDTMREKIREGLHLARRWGQSAETTGLLNPEAQELADALERKSVELEALDLSDPAASGEMFARTTGIVQAVIQLGHTQEGGLVCAGSLPDLRVLAREVRSTGRAAKTDVAAADRAAEAANACYAKFSTGVTETAEAAIDACRFEEAADAIGRIPPDLDERRALAAELDERRAGEDANRAALEAARQRFDGDGDPEAALEALSRGTVPPVCPETQTAMEEARGTFYTARFVTERTRTQIGECAFDKARREAAWLDEGNALRVRLEGEAREKETADADARADAERAWQSQADAATAPEDVVARLESARDAAPCPETQRVIQAWIDAARTGPGRRPPTRQEQIAASICDGDVAGSTPQWNADRSGFSCECTGETVRRGNRCVERGAAPPPRPAANPMAQSICTGDKPGSAPVFGADRKTFRCECPSGTTDLGDRCASGPPPAVAGSGGGQTTVAGRTPRTGTGANVGVSPECARLQRELQAGAGEWQRRLSGMQTGSMSSAQAHAQMRQLDAYRSQLLATQREYDVKCRGQTHLRGATGTAECAQLSATRIDRSEDYGRLVDASNAAGTAEARARLQPQLDAARAAFDQAERAYQSRCER